MKIVDKAATPALNVAVNLKDIARDSGGPIQGVTFLTKGTVTAGTIKLEGSFDNVDFFPITENGAQIEIAVNDFTFVKYRNMFVRCDISDVTSNDLTVEVQ